MVYRVLHRRPLVIAVYEPRWFMRVLSILRRREIPFSIYENPDTLPYYSVLYTDYYLFVEEARARSDIEVFYDPKHSCREFEKSILATRFKDKYNELVIGVDPGSKPYVIVLGDEEIIEHGRVSIDELGDFVNKCITCYPHEKAVIRVGGGYNGWKIVLRIKDVVDIPIEVVDEWETTPRTKRVDDPILLNKSFTRLNRFRNKDAYAALKIALRKGIEVT